MFILSVSLCSINDIQHCFSCFPPLLCVLPTCTEMQQVSLSNLFGLSNFLYFPNTLYCSALFDLSPTYQHPHNFTFAFASMGVNDFQKKLFFSQ